jgi:hypothetical protein
MKRHSSSLVSDSYVGNGAGGKLAPGVYLTNASKQRTYSGTHPSAYVGLTETASYTFYFFEVLLGGTKTAVQSQGPTALSLGQNVGITIVGAESNAIVTMNRADTFTITSSSDTAIGVVPTIASAVSGGAWNDTLPDTDLTKAYQMQSAIVEGDNTVTMQYADPNGDVFASDNTIVVSYASTAPIVEIDGQDITTDIETESYEVDVVYLYGGSLIEHGGEQVTYIGEVAYYGGTLVTVNNYALLPTQNLVQIVGLTDGYGASFSTTQELATKIPAIVYTGLTTIDEETYGTSYVATGTIDIDTGAPYQELGKTPSESPYGFISGQYEVYNKTASYEYPTATGVSNSIPVAITYQELAFSGLPQEADILQNIEGVGDIINILTYDPANGYVFAEDVTGTAFSANIFVDQGFTSATNFSYQLDFISLDYRNYTFNIPYENPITLEIFYVEVTVEYKATLVYEDFATNLMYFGDPTGGASANVTIIDDGGADKYQDVFDLIELGTGLSETTPADMPLVTVNGVGKNGGEMVISDVITLTKAYTGDEGWHASEHCFVITFQVPTARGPYFEFPTIEVGTGTVLQFLDFGGGFKVGANGTMGAISHTIRDYVTFLVGKDSSGDLRFYSSGGDDVNLGAFAGWQASDLILGNTDDRQTTDAIFYEISCVDHFPDVTERTNIYSRSATKWET